VAIDWLAHDMRSRGVPREYTDWITCKVTGRQTHSNSMDTNRATATLQGTGPGCPLLGIAFQFYNADLIDIRDIRKGEEE